MTVGCPGSGKTTWARQWRDEDPGSRIIVYLDDIRAALWGSKKTYHAVVGTGNGDPSAIKHPARRLLHWVSHNALGGAVMNGLDVCLANTHLYPASFEAELLAMEIWGIEPELVVFDVPLGILLLRNAARSPDDQVPADYLEACHKAMHADDAWWKTRPHTLITSLEICHGP